MARGQQIALGLGLDHIKQDFAKFDGLGDFFWGFGLLKHPQFFTQGFELLGVFHTHGPAGALHRTQQINRNGVRGALNVFKQQGRAAALEHTVRDFGYF